MLCLSIRQPWAWLILHAGKNIENRDWPTKVRGPILVHAGKGMTRDEYDDAHDTYLDVLFERFGGGLPPGLPELPDFEELPRGGIVGQVEIVDCVDASGSSWFFGRYGFKLANPRPLSFIPYRGQLGFFQVPDTILQGVSA